MRVVQVVVFIFQFDFVCILWVCVARGLPLSSLDLFVKAVFCPDQRPIECLLIDPDQSWKSSRTVRSILFHVVRTVLVFGLFFWLVRERRKFYLYF